MTNVCSKVENKEGEMVISIKKALNLINEAEMKGKCMG